MIFLDKLIKHRGLHNETIKENTYDAIKKALMTDKYVGVEFDVRETKDHEFIINHDPLYDGKLISHLNYNELPKYMPKLVNILKINSRKIFLIELKEIQSFNKLISLLKQYKNKNIYVMSFVNSLIDKINISSKTYKVGILNYVFNTSKESTNYDFVAIINSLLNETVMETLKPKEIFAYGIGKKYKYEGVYYITDD